MNFFYTFTEKTNTKLEVLYIVRTKKLINIKMSLQHNEKMYFFGSDQNWLKQMKPWRSSMAIRVVEFLYGVYKIRDIFA